jgi:hypothetical protein
VLAEAEVARVGGHLVIDEEYFAARARETFFYSPEDVKAESVSQVERLAEIFHVAEVEYDEDYFLAEAVERNADLLYKDILLEQAEVDAVVVNNAVYNSFLECLNDFMHIVYLQDLKINHADKFTDLHKAYLEEDGADSTFTRYTDCTLKTFSAMGFFAGDNFNEWWYDDMFAYYERINKVFYEG